MKFAIAWLPEMRHDCSWAGKNATANNESPTIRLYYRTAIFGLLIQIIVPKLRLEGKIVRAQFHKAVKQKILLEKFFA